MQNDFKPAQKHLFPSTLRLTDRMSESTVNFTLKRMGFDGRLTRRGLRATMSTALNEIGHPKAWVNAQLSHADPNRIRAAYNHAQHVEQRRVMMQERGELAGLAGTGAIEVASRHLIVHRQELPETPRPRDQAASG